MRRVFLAAGFIAVTALACGDQTIVPPTSPSSPTVLSIEITGPSTVAPGQSVQLTAVLAFSDGTKDAAPPGSPITWTTSNALLSVSATGLLSASQTRGESRVTARYNAGGGTRQASRTFLILPDGTFRLVGRVRDAESPTFPLNGVQVEVSQAGIATTTDGDGYYVLYGVPSGAVVRVSKPGYATISQPLELTTHTTRDFQLVLSGARLLLNGDYTLTLFMPPDCTGTLSPELRRRTYDASVTQTGALVEVVLTEPRFRLNNASRGNRFSGYADSSGITFQLDPLESYYYVYPTIAERLSNNTFFVPYGRSIVVRAGEGVSGGFDAWFHNFGAAFPNDGLLGSCRSSAAQLTLTPR